MPKKLFFKKSNLLSNITAPLYIPTSNVFKLCLFHISLALAIVSNFYLSVFHLSVCLSVHLSISMLGSEHVRHYCPTRPPWLCVSDLLAGWCHLC